MKRNPALLRKLIGRLFALPLLAAAGAIVEGQVASPLQRRSPARDPGWSVPGAADAVAWIGAEAIPAAALDAPTREAGARFASELANARRDALEDAIRDRLLEREGRRRGVGADRVYWEQIVRLVARPTEEEVRAEQAASPELRDAPLDAVRDQLGGTLRDRREETLFAEWAASARKRHRVVVRTDAGVGEEASAAVLATVDGVAITRRQLAERVAAREDELRWDLFREYSAAAGRAVRARLLDREAKRRGAAPVDVLEVEVARKVAPAAEEEIAAFFAKNSESFPGGLDAARPEIAAYLQSEARREAEGAFYRRLGDAASARLALAEPPPVTLRIETAGSPWRGSWAAPVVVVEFGDFECPACGGMWPLVETILRERPQEVRFVYRHSPLSMHPHAVRAAEAAVAAQSQGAFWAYADRLFRNQRDLRDEALFRLAAETRLDLGRFRKALASDEAAVAVVRDIREARRYRARGTPSYFVNGVLVRQYGESGLRRAIDRALGKTPPAS